jgi:dGTPase
VRAQPAALIGAGAELIAEQGALKRFLYERLYHHPRVIESMRQAERTLSAIYRAYRRQPALLPPQVTARFAEEGEARAIADYIAGMTDRFAVAEHERIRHDHAGIAPATCDAVRWLCSQRSARARRSVREPEAAR